MISWAKKKEFSNAFSFGEECIRFVSLEMTKQGVQVSHHARIELSGILDAYGTIVSDEQFVERMREFATLHKIENANVVVPDSAAVFFHTHVAREPAIEMNDVIIDHLKTYCEAHDLLEFSDYVCEYDVIHKSDFGYDIHVTLVAKSVVMHTARLFKQAGIVISHIETAHHAVAKACTGVPTGQGYVGVSVGLEKTTISIVHGTHLVSHDVVDVGVHSIVRAVEKRLRITRDEAEKIIARHGVMTSHPDSAVLSDIYLSVSKVVESIDAQIISIMKKEYKSFGDRFVVEKLVVYGMGLSVRGLADYLGAATRLPAVALDVWAASGIPRAPIINLPASDVPQYAEALSLGLIYLK